MRVICISYQDAERNTERGMRNAKDSGGSDRTTFRETYCDGISSAVQKFPVYRERIFRIKDALREKGLYGFYQYSSMDVYRAVLEFGVQDSEELIAKFEKK